MLARRKHAKACRYMNKCYSLVTRKHKIKCNKMSPSPSTNGRYLNNKTEQNPRIMRAREHVAGRAFLCSVGGKVN